MNISRNAVKAVYLLIQWLNEISHLQQSLLLLRLIVNVLGLFITLGCLMIAQIIGIELYCNRNFLVTRLRL